MMVERKQLARFNMVPNGLYLEASVGEPRFKEGRFHCRISHKVCGLNVPLLEEGVFRDRKVLVGRFNDVMEFTPTIEDPGAVSIVIEKAMDNYIQAYAELGALRQAERARVLGDRLRGMKMLGSGAHCAINLPGAFAMISAISAVIDISVGRGLDVGYFDFSGTPLRTAIRDETGEPCLLLPGGIAIAARPGH